MSFNFDQSHNVTDAVVYVRVSSKSQITRGDGLQGQQTRCEAYAEHKGYKVKKVFKDDMTGRSAERQGMLQLIEYLSSNRRNPHVVIVDDITRFARDFRVHFDFRDAIRDAGGILESPTFKVRDNADGTLQEGVLALMSHHQSLKNAEQSRDRIIARLMNGYATYSRPPRGYVYKAIKGRGKMLFRDEPLASVIQEGLESFASGRFETQTELTRFFESQPAFPKDLPNGKIRPQRIANILRHPIYAGLIESKAYGVSIREGQHEGLITANTFQKIQDRLDGKKLAPARKDYSDDFPLRNFLRCADCGKPMTASWSKSKTGKKYAYYRCKTKNQSLDKFETGKCPSYGKSIGREKVEGEFEKVLVGMKPSKLLLETVRLMVESIWGQRQNQLCENKTIIKRDLKSLDKKKDGILKRLIDSDSPVAISAYEHKLEELEKEKLILNEKLAFKPENELTLKELFEPLINFLENPHRIWASGHIHLQRMVLRLGFKEGLEYDREKGCLNSKKSLPFKLLGELNAPQLKMARPERFELPTTWFEAKYSIQLSYGRSTPRKKWSG